MNAKGPKIVPTTRAILEVSPSRVEIAILRSGQVVEHRSERFGRSEWPTPYTTQLPEVQTVITRLLSDLKLSKCAVKIIYTTPGAVSSVVAIPTNISSASAEQAARLSLAGVADFPVDDAPTDTCLIFTDTKRSADAGDPTPRHRHILACADAEQRTVALATAVQQCGLDIESMTPAEAVAIRACIAQATSLAIDETPVAAIWVGEHSTTIAAASEGRLLFVRSASSGLEALTEGLCRPLRPQSPDESPVTLAHTDARKLLFSVGVPTPDATVPGYPSLAGAALLPHLQPVLQRLSVEIKQSIRFSVPEKLRANVRLAIVGPGACVPAFAETIARLSGFSLLPAETTTVCDPSESSTGGLIAALLEQGKLGVCLLPSDIRLTQSVRRARKALVLGSAIAAAFIGYEALDTRLQLRNETARLESLKQQAVGTADELAIRQKTIDANKALAQLEQRTRSSVGQTPPWDAVLDTLSSATPPSIRIDFVNMTSDNVATGKVVIRGQIQLDQAADPSAVIRQLVSNLQQIPIIDSVRLGPTQRQTVRGVDAQAFDLTIGVVKLPPAYLPAQGAALTSAPTEGK